MMFCGWLAQACRHHIMEIILVKIYCICFSSSDSPENIRIILNKINQASYEGLALKEETETYVTPILETLEIFIIKKH